MLLAGCGKGGGEMAIEDILREEITGEITVSSYYDKHSFFDGAVKAFEAKYPGTKVNVEHFEQVEVKTFIGEEGNTGYTAEYIDDKQAESDYINRINTQIMGGGGADVLYIDLIPWYRYADAGYLEDLQIYMDNDSHPDYRMNVLNAVKYKDKQYIFPLSFSFDFFAYDASLFTNDEQKEIASHDRFTFGELINTAENASVEDNYIFGLTGEMNRYFDIWNPLLAESYASFVDIPNRKVYFDNGRFENLLLSVTEYNEQGYLWKMVVYDDTEPREDVNDVRFLFKQKIFDCLLQHFIKNINEFNPNLYIREPSYGIIENDVYAGLTADSNGGILLDARDPLALNSNSKNKRTAWEFIKFLASYDMQCRVETWGIPINKAAFENKIMNVDLTYGGFRPEHFENYSDIVNQETLEEYIAFADKCADTVNAYVLKDYTIDQMIEKEAREYFSGKKSANEAAAAVQSRVRLYLSE
jgi:ABC-type glycerol-3-phosphate transport system substrate-binding protein